MLCIFVAYHCVTGFLFTVCCARSYPLLGSVTCFAIASVFSKYNVPKGTNDGVPLLSHDTQHEPLSDVHFIAARQRPIFGEQVFPLSKSDKVRVSVLVGWFALILCVLVTCTLVWT